MLKTRALIWAKIESSYGVDAVPTQADAILCESPEIEPISRDLQRNNVKSYFGSLPSVPVGDGMKISFTAELKGSGSRGTAPEIGALLRSCCLTETVSAGASVTYAPNSNGDSGESCTIYFWRHNLRHAVLGCRGSFSIDLKAGEYGKVKFDMQGNYAGPTDTAMGSATYDSTLPPRWMANNTAFTIDSFAAVLASFKVDVKNDIKRRPNANSSSGTIGFFIGERGVTGEIDPEAPTVASKNLWGMWYGGLTYTCQAVVGSSNGNIITLSGNQVQLNSPKYGDRESILTYTIPLTFTPSSSGNDEISIAFT